jgi:hypothetical protein
MQTRKRRAIDWYVESFLAVTLPLWAPLVLLWFAAMILPWLLTDDDPL